MIIKSSIKDYSVHFLDSTFSWQSPLSKDDVLVVDKNVYMKWNHLFDLDCMVMPIEAIESNKSYSSVGNVLGDILSSDFTRTNKIVAVGGGIIQDICGFVSSILYRGVSWEFYPTTLLSQGDSCIGGKTSINFENNKNQLGNFNPPDNVYIYPDFTNTLSVSDFRSGLGEMLHFYLVSSESDFEFYMDAYRRDDIDALIRRCLQIKKTFVELDEFDRGERLLLNYGHTFGHAIESITEYKIPHGIAVSYGMMISNYISSKLGCLDFGVYNRLNVDIINSLISGYNFSLYNHDVDSYISFLTKDKKNITSDKIRCVLTGGIGQMFLHDIDIKDLRCILMEFINEFN